MSAPKIIGNDGFTLLETLIAFLILAASITVAIQTLSQNTLFMSNAKIDEDLRVESRKLLAALERSVSGPARLEGKIDGNYSWNWEVERYDAASEIFAYTLTVKATERPRARAVYLGFVWGMGDNVLVPQ